MSISVSSYPPSSPSPQSSNSLKTLYISKFSTIQTFLSTFLSVLNSALSSFASALSSILDFDPKISILESTSTPFCFYFNESVRSFTKINLETLKKQPETTCFQLLPSFTSGARVSNTQFFLHGGCKNYEASHETCLYDVHSNSITRLPKSNFAKNGGACVRLKNQVFAFTSTYPISRKSEAFDLRQKTWRKINDVPIEIRFLTATGGADEIYMTGAGVFGLLVYDILKDSYSQIPGLPGGYKVLLQNFVLTSSGLFEAQKEGLKKYNVEWLCSPLQISIPFRQKNKIYFIDCHKKICRLDLSNKSVEKLSLA